MSRWYNQLAERFMRKAELDGSLRDLPGQGAPLPERPGDAFVDAGDAIGFRIMAEAGVLPEEILLKKAIAAHLTHLATLTDPAERKAAMAELARLQMRQAIAEEARRKFLAR